MLLFRLHRYPDGGVLIYPDTSYIALQSISWRAVDTLIKTLCKNEQTLEDLINDIKSERVGQVIQDFFKTYDLESITCNSFIYTGSENFYYPVYLSYEVTHRCNLNCKHCYINKRSIMIDKELKAEDVEFFLSKINKYNLPLNIQVTGGEPLLRKDIWEIIEVVSKHTMESWTFNTNGLLINKEIAEKLESYNVDKVYISLEGDKESHEYLRGKGTFEKVLEAIRIFNKYTSIPVEINTMVTKRYPDTIKRVVKILSSKNLKYNQVHIGFFLPVWNAKNAELIKELLLTPHEFYSNEHRKEWLKGSKIDDTYFDYTPSKAWNYHCGAGFYNYVLDPYGNIFPCMVDRTKLFYMGNILRDSNEQIFKEQAEKYFKRNPVPFSYCKNCKYYLLCKSCMAYQSAFCNRGWRL